MRPTTTLALAALTVACAPAATPDAAVSDAAGVRGDRALVTRVVDGDTAEVLLDGREVDVRFIGVDTPESVAPDRPVECFGGRASAYTESRLEGRTVRLEFDMERRDRFGRVLAYVWLGDELFNQTLVAQGYAVVTTFPPTCGTSTASSRHSARRARPVSACGERARRAPHRPRSPVHAGSDRLGSNRGARATGLRGGHRALATRRT